MGQPVRDSQNILITGGAGFIGANLLGRLLRDDAEADGARLRRIVVFDTFGRNQHANVEEFASHPKVTLVQGDVRDRDAVDRATEGIDQLYHLSSIVGIPHYCEDPLAVIDVNVVGTRHVLECALKKDVRLLFTSTSEVFGKNPRVPWKEDDDRVLGSTRIERWSYSSSKAVCEQMLFALAKHKGLRGSIVRFFNVYGPKQHPIFVVSQGIARALRGEPPLLYDSGEQRRCFTYVEDAVEGMIRAATLDAAVGEAFNIGSCVPNSIREVNEMILDATGLLGRVGMEPVDTREKYGDRYEDIPCRIPDVEKAARVLRWKAQVPLREGIRRFVEWARAHWVGKAEPAHV